MPFFVQSVFPAAHASTTIHVWGQPGCEWKKPSRAEEIPNLLISDLLEYITKIQKSDSSSIGAEPFFEAIAPAQFQHCPPTPSEVARFCADNSRKTSTVTNHPAAFFALKPTCPSQDEMLKRNVEKFRYLAQSFNQKIQDPQMALQCCGNQAGESGDSSCVRRWKETRLLVVAGLPPNNQTVHTETLSHKPSVVMISIPMVANCRSQGCIDRALLHELGHVCINSVDLKERGKRKMMEAYFQHLTQVTGSEAAQCIQDAIFQEDQKQSRNSHDVTVWYEEAVANATFSSGWNAEAYGWACMGDEDYDHAELRAYLQCFSKIPATAKKLCAGF